ncbi:MAG: CpsD/CapB family tyrosine-protein kinase [Chloroflexi bacterium]|nr:MAG: CpsD/CapB family tyrosine-protein kinase [Chloroflexota bacterium]
MADAMTDQDVDEAISAALKPRPVPPGFADIGRERTRPISLPPWFIDRCRQAYLAVPFEEREGQVRRVLGITSAVHGEGKTSIAIGIAVAMAADTAEPTLLVETDFASSVGFEEVFGLKGGPGLAGWLEGLNQLRLVRAAPLENAFVLPAGDPGPDPTRLVFRLTNSDLIDKFRASFPNIVIDLPPMLNIAYSSLASRLAEKILVIARYGRTMVDDLEKVMFLLGRERVAGVVLNDYNPKTPSSLRRLL